MILIYRLLFLPFFIVFFLKNLPKMFRRGGYGSDLGHRFGFLPRLPKTRKKRLWIQAVSVGEVNAITRLLLLLGKKYEIILTTTTTTARKIIREKLAENVLFHGYFPWDFWLCSWVAWQRIRPDAIILVESELWPEHIWQARRRGVPIFLVNARLSEQSFQRYRKFCGLARWIFGKIDFIVASSEENRQKIAPFYNKSIEYFGNMKLDTPVRLLSERARKVLKKELGFSENSLVLLGCSTWPGEEAMILEAFREICRRYSLQDGWAWSLLIVPRHAERRGELVQWLGRENISFWQRSRGKAMGKVSACLADTTGELGQLAQVADLAYIGKSLAPNVGGQSPLDAAMAKVPIIYGDRMTNFHEICTQLEEKHATIRVKDRREAIDTIVDLAGDEKRRQVLGENLGQWLQENRGASVRTYAFIQKRL
jgi:3-deoxy-D-manno-octulosonic-acid transferase